MEAASDRNLAVLLATNAGLNCLWLGSMSYGALYVPALMCARSCLYVWSASAISLEPAATPERRLPSPARGAPPPEGPPKPPREDAMIPAAPCPRNHELLAT